MAQVEIIDEQEVPRGWVFHAQALDEQGSLTRHRLTLSWADYNLWSRDGADEPAQVAQAALHFLVQRLGPAQIGERVDASLARRRFADADEVIPRLIDR